MEVEGAQEWTEELLAEMPKDPVVPKFLLNDSEESFAEASPKGGIIPEGAASTNFGNCSVSDLPLTRCTKVPVLESVNTTPKVTTAKGFQPFLLTVLTVILTANLVAWPTTAASSPSVTVAAAAAAAQLRMPGAATELWEGMLGFMGVPRRGVRGAPLVWRIGGRARTPTSMLL